MFKKLKNDVRGMLDITMILGIGILFAGLMMGAYVLWTLYTQLLPAAGSSATFVGRSASAYRNMSKNITGGFDNAVTLILVAITVLILAIAISALLVLRGGSSD